MAELTAQGRKYDIVTTDTGYAENVVAKKRCAIRIEYGLLSNTNLAALTALRDAGRKDPVQECNFQVHLGAVCESCQKGLTPSGIAFFVSAPMYKKTLGGNEPNKCPSCGHEYCYLIYDPDGYPRLTA